MKPDLSNALTAAPTLLGWLLVHESPEGLSAGYIVETECYLQTDAASHSYRGITPRTKVMFGPAGYLYVYFTYGMHYCVNIVAGPEGQGEAVLLRALEPVEGLELMRLRRNKTVVNQLTNGPAKLAQAMGINRSHNGESIWGNGPFRLLPGIKPNAIVRTARVGISREIKKPWRFYIAGSPYVSRL